MSHTEDSVILRYNQADGIMHPSDVQKLPTSDKNIEKALDICEEITKYTKKNKLILWLCFLMPIGLVIMVLSGLFLSSPLNFIGIFVGLILFILFPLLVCITKSRKEKVINKFVAKFREKTNGDLEAVANYEMRTQSTKSGLKTYKALASITVTVKKNFKHKSQKRPKANSNNTALPYGSYDNYNAFTNNPQTSPQEHTQPDMNFQHHDAQPIYNPNDPYNQQNPYNGANSYQNVPQNQNLNNQQEGGSHYPTPPPGFSQFNQNMDGNRQGY
jgi:hypothetical protein